MAVIIYLENMIFARKTKSTEEHVFTVVNLSMEAITLTVCIIDDIYDKIKATM